MSKELSKDIAGLTESAQNYIEAKIDLLKLTFLERMARFTTFLFSFIILALFFILIAGLAAAMFILWYGQEFGNYIEGTLIATGILALFALLFFLFRKKIITNTAVRNFSDILFLDEKENEKQ